MVYEDVLTGSSVAGDVSAEPRGMDGSHGDKVLRVRLQLGQKRAGLLRSDLQLSQSQGQNFSHLSAALRWSSDLLPSSRSSLNP